MPRYLAIRSLDLLNKVGNPIDSLFLKSDGPANPPLFIVGAPRSGTTLAYQIVTQQMKVGHFTIVMNYLYGLPNLITRTFKPFLDRPAPVFESQYGKIHGVWSPAENANFWFRWFPRDGKEGHYLEPTSFSLERYRKLKATVDSMTRILAKPMVFKSVYLSMVVGALAQIFSEAQFVFVRRDRFFTCQSLLLARQRRRKPDEWWSVKIPGYRQLATKPIWHQVVDQVVSTEAIIQRDLEKFAPRRYLVLNYEDVCIRPRHAVSTLEEWLRPVGYSSYSDIRVPESFQISDQPRLPADVVANIKERLAKSVSEEETA